MFVFYPFSQTESGAKLNICCGLIAAWGYFPGKQRGFSKFMDRDNRLHVVRGQLVASFEKVGVPHIAQAY